MTFGRQQTAVIGGCAMSVKTDDYVKHDGLGLAELVRRGEASPAELAEAAIALIEKHNPTLNAVTQRMDDYARSAVAAGLPDGPLKGVPYLLKDLFANLPGVPSNNGSAIFKGWTPPYESTIVTKAREAGLVIVGKSASPELGVIPTTEPKAFGPCRNPWNTKHTPGGSSGGAAAAVAAGIVPAAHASDGGGSIRIPASCCGIFGLKPSRGRVSAGPAEADGWNGLATSGVVSRTVRDSAAFLDAIEGGTPGEPYAAPAKAGAFLGEVGRPPGRLKVAVSRQAASHVKVHPDCLAALDDAAKLMASLGHEVVEADPEIDPDRFETLFWQLVSANTAADLIEFADLFGHAPGRNEMERWTFELARMTERTGAAEFMLGFRNLWRLHRPMGAFLARHDVLLTPTLGSPPVPLGTLDTDMEDAVELRRRINAFIPFTPLANALGHPAMTVPLHWNAEGLPVGVMFQARLGADDLLFRLAGQLEEARPWKDRHPPIWG
jgi:Asp-tRNA(Asn)/Glu-tRNA(Gln) amidotransferase A subunit family amidase